MNDDKQASPGFDPCFNVYAFDKIGLPMFLNYESKQWKTVEVKLLEIDKAGQYVFLVKRAGRLP